MNNIYILIAICAIGYAIYLSLFKSKDFKLKDKSKDTIPKYFYSLKQSFITPSEKEFYKILSEVAADRYYIFPQIHLSSLFENDTNGRYHKLAFQRINRMSVDYVLCDKITLEPIYAVELDDPSHNEYDSRKNDDIKNDLFKQMNLPLVRFSNYKNLNQEDIAKRFFEAKNNQ
jgi:hypothetical protein